MGGITGIVRTGTAIEEAERAFIGVGQPLQVVAEGGGWALSARARSTLAVSDHYVVALAGHFDRAPGTGQSAAQILLDTWEKYGIDALMRVEGTWVAAVYDRRQQRLHLLRDPFGIRRLFFVQKGGKIAFSTQARNLLELPWVSRELARENLSEFLSFRYVHAPRTLGAGPLSGPGAQARWRHYYDRFGAGKADRYLDPSSTGGLCAAANGIA